MTSRRRPARRPGYTLLEVLLASGIAVLLLAALYATLDITLVRMDVNRDQVNGNDLGRAVVNRMSADLSASLGALQPRSGLTSPQAASTSSSGAASGSSSSAGAGSSTGSPTASATAGTGTGSGTASASGTGSGTSSTASDSGSTDDPAQAAVDVPFQAGVVGTDKQVTLFSSRVPQALADPDAAADPTAVLPADLRRVTYYLAADGGLCRQERPWVTADGVRNSADPDRATEATDVIAPEVRDATFEYFDGSGWQAAWDGTQPGADGSTPVGPPRAIRATLTLEFVGRGGQAVQKRIQHVFPVRAAGGTYQPDAGTGATDSGTGTTAEPSGTGATSGGM